MEVRAPADADGPRHERALREVGETMLTIEVAIRRVERALDTLARDAGAEAQAVAGLVRAKRDLEGVRRRLHQEVYLHTDLLPFE